MRSDQLRNRLHLIEVARRAFVEGEVSITLEEIARRAGLAPSSLFRHFPSKDDLYEAVMTDLFEGVRAGAARAIETADAVEALRLLFGSSCRMSDAEIAAFGALALDSPRLNGYADKLINDIVTPFVQRLEGVANLKYRLAVDDVTLLVRMLEIARSDVQRDKLISVFLAGLTGEQPVMNPAD